MNLLEALKVIEEGKYVAYGNPTVNTSWTYGIIDMLKEAGFKITTEPTPDKDVFKYIIEMPEQE